jgi:hypothetical protein
MLLSYFFHNFPNGPVAQTGRAPPLHGNAIAVPKSGGGLGFKFIFIYDGSPDGSMIRRKKESQVKVKSIRYAAHSECKG